MRNSTWRRAETRRLVLVAALVAATLITGVGEGRATVPRTLVVDRDGVQCANAEFTSIQAAVDAAQAGDLIRVCPDLYTEALVVDKSVTLKADPDAVEAIDCFQPTLGELPADQQAIVDPPGDGFSIAFELEANDIVLEGFVVQGTSVGINTSDRFSGYWVHHNLVRLNTLFAIDFGSEGTRESRVDHNCFRDSRFGLVSELDNDEFWPDRENRGPDNARDLTNARIDHNATFQNLAGLEATGPGRRVRVTFDHNVSRGDRDAIYIQNSEASAIVANVTTPLRFGILMGGANVGLEVAGNRVVGGLLGIGFIQPTFFIDVFPAPTIGAVVRENTLTDLSLEGMAAVADRVHGSLFLNNVTSDNLRDGIQIRIGNSGNAFRGNVAERNNRYGIYAQGATGNVFEANQMFGNDAFDARDDARESNTWIANHCVTDFPAGTICGVS